MCHDRLRNRQRWRVVAIRAAALSAVDAKWQRAPAAWWSRRTCRGAGFRAESQSACEDRPPQKEAGREAATKETRSAEIRHQKE